LSAELQALAASRVALDHVVAIENATEKSAMLTRQLLTFSRKQMIRPVELNINTTIQAFRPLLKQLLDDTVNLEIRLAS
jgi:two-component system cell cycle sensor histidine kinase/response regulator CckA